MKVNLLPRTNIEKALSKSRKLTQSDHNLRLEEFVSSLDIKSINKFDFDLLDSDKIYHISQIKKVSIDYRLRFLDLKYFKNKLPNETLEKIQLLENTHNTKIGSLKIMAPSVLFRLKKTDDPLLFAPIGNDYYYLIHKWGNDLHPLRKILMWPFKNIWNLLAAIFLFSWIITELTPMSLFTRNHNISYYWMLLFFMFKAIASVVLYFGFALGKNFNPAIWNSRYNKAF